MSEINLPHNHNEDSHIVTALNLSSNIKEFDKTAEIFKQLGDGSRLRIFLVLCHCEDCVLNIAAMVGMSSPAVSHHLKSLKAKGLITSRRDGKEMYYKVSDTPESKLLHNTIEQLLNIVCPEL